MPRRNAGSLEFGKNQVEEIAREPLLLTFVKEFGHFFAIILWIAAGLSFFAEWNDPGKGMATLGFAIIGVIVINGVFSFWQTYRAEQALAVLKKLLPHSTKITRGGAILQVPADELVPGDVILLESGDIIPADCRLVEAFGVRVNNATITGESLPSSRDAAPCEETELIRSRNILLAGTSLVSGEAKALVFATGSHSAFGQIARLTQETTDTISPLQTEISRVSRIVAGLSLSLGVVFFFIGQAIGLPFWANFIFAIGIIVANVPEGLLPTVTLSLAMASQRMAKRNALIRHLPAVEALGCTTVICTDKTGTLTQNRMSARRVFIAGNLVDVSPDQLAALRQTHPRFFEVAGFCHDLKILRRRLAGRSDGSRARGTGVIGDGIPARLSADSTRSPSMRRKGDFPPSMPRPMARSFIARARRRSCSVVAAGWPWPRKPPLYPPRPPPFTNPPLIRWADPACACSLSPGGRFRKNAIPQSPIMRWFSPGSSALKTRRARKSPPPCKNAAMPASK